MHLVLTLFHFCKFAEWKLDHVLAHSFVQLPKLYAYYRRKYSLKYLAVRFTYKAPSLIRLVPYKWGITVSNYMLKLYDCSTKSFRAWIYFSETVSVSALIWIPESDQVPVSEVDNESWEISHRYLLCLLNLSAPERTLVSSDFCKHPRHLLWLPLWWNLSTEGCSQDMIAFCFDLHDDLPADDCLVCLVF